LSSRSVYSESAPILEETRPTLSLIEAMLEEMIVKSCLKKTIGNNQYHRKPLTLPMLLPLFPSLEGDLLSEKEVKNKDDGDHKGPDAIHRCDQRVVQVQIVPIKRRARKRGQNLVRDQRQDGQAQQGKVQNHRCRQINALGLHHGRESTHVIVDLDDIIVVVVILCRPPLLAGEAIVSRERGRGSVDDTHEIKSHGPRDKNPGQIGLGRLKMSQCHRERGEK